MSRADLSSLCALAMVLAGAGCRGQTSADPPIAVLRDMFNQDRCNPQAESQLFLDGRTMRMPVLGTVAREREIDPELGQGRLPDDSDYVAEVPQAIAQRFGGAPAMIERGLERYDIYCRPCHDGTGAGRGTVITRSNWQPAPPSFHMWRLLTTTGGGQGCEQRFIQGGGQGCEQGSGGGDRWRPGMQLEGVGILFVCEGERREIYSFPLFFSPFLSVYMGRMTDLSFEKLTGPTKILYRSHRYM